MARLLLRVLVVLLSLTAAAAFSVSAMRTVSGGVKADAIEQTILDQSRRFAVRDLTYSEPVHAEAPLPMPGFPALVAALVGVDVPQLELVRTLALTATLFTALLLLCLVHFETASWTLAIAAAGMFLFGQGLLATTPGLARPEALLFLFVLLGFASLRFLVGIVGSLAAGILFGLAYFIDSGALVFLLGALISQALDERRRLATLAVVAGLIVAAGTILLSPRLGPWLSDAAWSGPLERFAFDPQAALVFATSTLLGKLGLFCLVLVLSCALSSQPWRDREGLWIWLGVSAVAAGAFDTQHAGGAAAAGASDASAIGASVAALALLGTLALQRVVHHLADRGDDAPSGETVIMGMLVIQFVVFAVSATEAAWVRALSIAG